MADQTTAAAPTASEFIAALSAAAPVAQPSKFGAVHFAGLTTAAVIGNEYVTPVVDYVFQLLHPAIMPSATVENTLGVGIAVAVGLAVIRIIKGRAGVAAAIGVK